MIAVDKTKPNPKFLREDPPSDMYAFGSVSAAVDGLPSNQQRTMATLVSANITAREVVVLGRVSGNVYATDRVDIRSEGSLTGDVTTGRITIDEGAYFKGGIDIRKSSQGKNKVLVAGHSGDHAQTAAATVEAKSSALKAS